MSMPRMMAVVCGALLAVSPVMAEPYWVSWSGDSYPEEEGWTRFRSDANGVDGQGGALRTVVDGAMVLDSRRSRRIVDFYRWTQLLDPAPGESFVLQWGLDSRRSRRIVDFYRWTQLLDPAPGESFVLQWGLRVDEVNSSVSVDPGMTIFSDDAMAIGFEFAEDGFRSVLEPDSWRPLTPGVFHNFEVVSMDMQSYAMFVDGEFLRDGQFRPGGDESKVLWGDAILGASSQSTWDYVAIGVVPEPGSWLLVMVLMLPITRRLK